MSDGISEREALAADRRHKRVGRVCDGGLNSAISRAGGTLLGISVKWSEYDVLITVRALMPAGRVICFVGSETLAGALLKAYREAGQDLLKWRPDRYAAG
jgi:hypothetical protein